MGGEQDVVELEQRIVRGDGLRVQGIEAGGLDVALGQGMRESVLIDDTPRSMLTKYAVGFIMASSCAPIRWRVSSVSAQTTTTTSASRSNVGRSTLLAPASTPALRFALHLDMTDLEDAMQVAAASAWGADVIATRNLRDFRKSPIPAQSPANLLRTPME